MITILISLIIISVIINIIIYLSKKKLSVKYKTLQQISDDKLSQLYSKYYAISSIYVSLLMEHVNISPEYITKLHDIDREAIYGILCANPKSISATSFEYIINLLLEKVFNDGDSGLTKNERLLLEIAGKII